jgi:hypothetical protein
MFFRLLGPKLCAKLAQWLCLLACILIGYYMLPVLAADVLTLPVHKIAGTG